MRCAALTASTLAEPLTNSAKISEGSRPETSESDMPIEAGVRTVADAAGTGASPPMRSSGMARRRGCTVMRT